LDEEFKQTEQGPIKDGVTTEDAAEEESDELESINSLHPSSNTLLSFTSFYVASIRMYFSLDRLRDLNKDIDDGRDKKRCAYVSDSDKHKPWQAVNVINELLS
ncbi:9330_t:CDS:2, partial [Paraglomus brasilianum]